MNHNKHNLMVGQIVWLDDNYQNKSEVGIFAFTPNEMYATVYAKNETSDMWQVMTNRLTPNKIHKRSKKLKRIINGIKKI